MKAQEYYTKTMAFKKAKSAYDIAFVAVILFWMPMIVLALMYFFID
jgi:hypothetical protein